MIFKRGDRVRYTKSGKTGTVLKAEDFNGYDYNRPNDKWELIKWDIPYEYNGRSEEDSWVGNTWLEKLGKLRGKV